MPKLKLPAIKFLNSKKRKFIALGIVIVLVAAVGGTYPLWHKKPAKTSGEVLTYSPDKPDEKKPGNDYKWVGGPNDPKKINLPTLNIDGFMQKVGVDQHKAMAVPGNIHMAGWFNVEGYVRPGENGLSIIDGHVDGYTDKGIFYNLKNLKKGDQYSIEFGDGHSTNFKVVDVQSVANDKAAEVLYSSDPALKKQVNLITCGGKFDKTKREYENRIIVISEAV